MRGGGREVRALYILRMVRHYDGSSLNARRYA